jgi:dTDP-4-dehydrorhamnose reductase
MLLVLGAGGQVGRALVERIGDTALGLDEKECDICETTSVARALSAAGLSAVVNAPPIPP